MNLIEEVRRLREASRELDMLARIWTNARGLHPFSIAGVVMTYAILLAKRSGCTLDGFLADIALLWSTTPDHGSLADFVDNPKAN